MQRINFNHEDEISRVGPRTGRVLLKKSTQCSKKSIDGRP